MTKLIISALKAEGIERIGFIPLSECEVINERILPDWGKTAVIFSIPYRSVLKSATDGFSEYARIYDYHKYSSELYSKIELKLNNLQQERWQGFCDHSPINEKLAAAKCGLGVIGRNSLFIDNVYGSYVFIGSIIIEQETAVASFPITCCADCALCIDACPTSAIIDKGIDRTKCLSAISQKKNKTDEEKSLLRTYNIKWGCDICQNVCPYNKNAMISPIKHFKETRIDHIDYNFIESLTDEEFQKFAFSYRGKKTVLDNFGIE